MNVRERPVDEVIKELGLPAETKYLGYVVYPVFFKLVGTDS